MYAFEHVARMAQHYDPYLVSDYLAVGTAFVITDCLRCNWSCCDAKLLQFCFGVTTAVWTVIEYSEISNAIILFEAFSRPVLAVLRILNG